LSYGEIPASAKALEATRHLLSREAAHMVITIKIYHQPPLSYSLSLGLLEFCDGD